MQYDDQIATIYRVENGFVVECREEKPAKDKPKKDAGCCMPSSYETKTYTAANEAAVVKFLKEKLAALKPDQKEYDDAFAAATKQ